MRLKPIDDGCLSDALSLLSRGFPERTADFWNSALVRLSKYREDCGMGSIGQLMMVGDLAVGIILTIPSKRTDGRRDLSIVNLAAWYVDANYRWLALRMLHQVVADDTVVYTSLSPAAATAAINTHLGFRTATQGVIVVVLPWIGLTRLARSRVIEPVNFQDARISPVDRDMLAQHRELGCIAAVLDVDGNHYPLLFSTTRRKGLPVARLLLAESRQLIGENIAAIARFLVRRGNVLLTVHANEGDIIPGGVMRKRSAPTQVKGPWGRNQVDHAFSELAFLKL